MNAVAKMTGMPKSVANLATKTINSVGSKARKGKKPSTKMVSRGVKIPAGQAISISRLDSAITQPMDFEFTFLKLSTASRVQALICPWQTLSVAGIEASWDQRLVQVMGTFTEYRCLGASIKYLGTAPSTSTNQIYMGGSKNPTTDLPEYDEFSLLESFHAGPMFDAGAEISIPHDDEWHGINDDVLGTSSANDRKLFCCGKVFCALDHAGYTASFTIKMRFQFRGKDPVISATDMAFGLGGLGSTLASTIAHFGQSTRSNWQYSASITGLALKGLYTTLRSGYWGLTVSLVDVAAGDASQTFAGVKVTDGSTDVTSQRTVVLMTNSASTNTNTKLVGASIALIRVFPGDVVAVCYDNASTTNVLSMSATRVSESKAQALYNLGAPGLPLPV